MSNIQSNRLQFEAEDKDNPRKWSRSKRILVSLLPLPGALSITSSNSIYIAAVPRIISTFNVSMTLALLPITVFTLGLSFGPALSAAFSEIYGRRPVYFISLTGAIIFTAVAGQASNYQTLTVCRFLAGLFGSPMITIVIGTLNDIWDPINEKVGSSFVALFAAIMIWGTEIGPVVGEAILKDTDDWRWTFWITIILLGVACIVWISPETYASEILRQKARKNGFPVPPRKRFFPLMKIVLGRPLTLLFVEPIIFPTSFISSLSLCVVFFFYVAFPLVFQQVYSFTPYQSGLAFLSLFVGSILGIVIMAIFDKMKYQPARQAAYNQGRTLDPEERLHPVMVGGIILPISVFWFGWTVYSKVHWIVPMLSGVPFGMAFLLVMLGWPLYKNDVYGSELGASALAAENFLRYLLSAFIPLFTKQMIDKMGIHWAMSLVAFISLVLVPVPWIIYKTGPRLRQRSQYAQKNNDRNPT